tara:strand:- start:107 stop:736 length:630 start_codon:yes stop_codon:yes gene_type:complete
MTEIPAFKPLPQEPRDCSDTPVWGDPSTNFSYISKYTNNNLTPATLPPGACRPRYHSNAQIDILQVNTSITGPSAISGATGTFTGTVTASTLVATNLKTFNIPHPTKENKRLVYSSLEGPEAGVYVRGRVRNTTEIILPDYWEGLVDKKTITVNLTPIGAHQDVIVKGWSLESIQLQSKGGMPIDCFYTVYGERKDIPSLVVEQDEVVD